MKRNSVRSGAAALLVFAAVCSLGCATVNPKDDPLKYTKKLATEGHVSLYKNGAFKVPNTSISLIPAGPDTLELVQEFAGMRARKSFKEAIRRAADSVYIVSEGTKLTYRIYGDISSASNDAAADIRKFTRENGKLIVYRSSDLGKSIIGKTWDVSKDVFQAGQAGGRAIVSGTRSVGNAVADTGTSQGMAIISGSVQVAKDITAAAGAGGEKISEQGAGQGMALVAGSIPAAKNVVKEGSALGDRISEGGTRQGMDLAAGSFSAAKNVIKEGSVLGDRIREGGTHQGMDLAAGSFSAAKNVAKEGSALGDTISVGGTRQGMDLAAGSFRAAGNLSRASVTRSGSTFRYAGSSFVRGYVAVPSNMKKHANEMGDSLADGKFGAIVREENERRRDWQKPAVDLMSNTASQYTANVSDSFRKAGKELQDSSTTGLSFAVLRSMRWVLQGILWDATIEPVTKMTAASVGYIGVNCVAFPSLVIVREGVSTAKVAVEVTWDASKMGYDLVAPSGVAAVAGVYGLVDLVGSHAAAGGTAVLGSAAGVGEAVVSNVAGVTVKGGGYAAAGATAAAGTIAGLSEAGLSQASGIAIKGGSYPVAGGTLAVGTVAGAGEAVLSKAAGVAVKGASYPAAGVTVAAGTAAGVSEAGLSKAAGFAVKGAGYPVAGVTLAAGTIAGAGEAAASEVSSIVIKSGGYAAGKTIQYIGVPLASAGIAVTGGTIGTAIGGAGVTAGGVVFTAGEAGAGGTQVFGNVIAGTTLAGGTAISAGSGAAYGVYELSKAVVVPAGYNVGSGIVLSYDTLAQLSAQSILAVSDCAYMVLSLEGPRWVLYAVRGRVDSGDDLPAGAVVDLKGLQKSGEEIVNLPVTEEEMKKIVESVYDSLPEFKTEGKE